MAPDGVGKTTIAEKAKSERIYLHYALLLSFVCLLLGVTLTVLGVGDHLDIVVEARGVIETRLINATPGIGLFLLGGAIFVWSKPRRLKYTASTEIQENNGPSNEDSLHDIEQTIIKCIAVHLTNKRIVRTGELETTTNLFLERINLLERRLYDLAGHQITDGIDSITVDSPIYGANGERSDGVLSPARHSETFKITPDKNEPQAATRSQELGDTESIPKKTEQSSKISFNENLLYQSVPSEKK